jgi:hypothetical protein
MADRRAVAAGQTPSRQQPKVCDDLERGRRPHRRRGWLPGFFAIRSHIASRSCRSTLSAASTRINP